MTTEGKEKVALETYTLIILREEKLLCTLKSKKGIDSKEVLIIINIKDYG